MNIEAIEVHVNGNLSSLRAYLAEAGVSIERVEVEGQLSDFRISVEFRHVDRPGCKFSYTWSPRESSEEEELDAPDAANIFVSLFCERILAEDSPALPEDCSTDSVTSIS